MWCVYYYCARIAHSSAAVDKAKKTVKMGMNLSLANSKQEKEQSKLDEMREARDAAMKQLVSKWKCDKCDTPCNTFILLIVATVLSIDCATFVCVDGLIGGGVNSTESDTNTNVECQYYCS